MEKFYKPEGYNCLSPYLVVENSRKLADFLKAVFNAAELQKFENPDGTIMHMEMKIDDSVIMLADSNVNYPARMAILHVYVPDVFHTFQRAADQGCKMLDQPAHRPGEPNIRGSFMDFAGNYWSVSTRQV